jgi:hypothetical protein
MWAYSFDLWADGEFLVNIVVHATGATMAWLTLGNEIYARGVAPDDVRLLGAVAV